MARRTKEDAQATRTALLDAAECVFQKRGVSRTSLNDIAQAAGVTRGALYWHFKDKADLYNAMMERVTLPLESTLPDVTGENPVAALRQGLRQALRQIASDEQTRRVLEIATLMVEHTEELGAVRDRLLQSQREHMQCVQAALESASRLHGITFPAPLAQLAQGMHAMVHGLIFSWLLEPSFDLEAAGLSSLDAFLRGIGLSSQIGTDNQG